MGADLSSASRRQGAKPEINITPLVDVVLVLLIIFMVVTPQMEAGISVSLPSVTAVDESNAPVNPTTVSISREGHLFLEKEALDSAALVDRLRALHQRRPASRVVIKADQGVEYGKVRHLFHACQEIGFPGASLQVLDQSNKKEG